MKPLEFDFAGAFHGNCWSHHSLPIHPMLFFYNCCVYLGDNYISSIPPEIGNLMSLETLSLGECMVLDCIGKHLNLILPVHSMEIVGLITPYQSIHCWFFYTCCVYLDNNDIYFIPPEIGNLMSLETLSLGECMVLD
jgi:hypothetical protein